MNIIKSFIRIYLAARDFEIQMNIMDSMRSKKETYKIKATKEQMNILTMVASYGATVNDVERAFRLLSLKRQDEIAGD